MIGTRTAAAFAVLLGIAAIALAATALAVNLRGDDSRHDDQLIATGIARVDGDPVGFPLHDFYLSGDADGRVVALYTYTPGYLGHVRGCKVVWVPTDIVQVAGRLEGPGLFVDPCGGARFNRYGDLVAGEADRGLDYFQAEPSVAGVLVDIARLFCGAIGPRVPVSPVLATSTPMTAPPVVTAKPISSPVSPTLTPTASPTPTATESPTPASRPTPEKCDRVGR